MIAIGKYLKTKRFFKELTLQQVVDDVREQYGYSTSTSVLSAIETNKNKFIDGKLLFILADLYEIDLNEFKNIILQDVKKKGELD
ncbi:hypothetical protein [Companilactobacillus jidongensis]|uniref:hypothetical protein n=1 Tax=Companilactobacillus jidongensis TaxID=2486006 RepID=UPI000F76A487|nr:hypothetical protein [Companilactobacillus jidongensis]